MGQGNSQVQYSVAVTKKEKGETAIYRSIPTEKGLYQRPEEGIITMKDAFLKAVERYGDKPCLFQKNLKTKLYEGKSYNQILQIAKEVGSGIINLNMAPQVNEYNNLEMQMVGIFSKNRQEWLILDVCNFLYGFTMVPLYETLGPENISYCLNHSGLYNVFAQESSVNILLKQDDLGRLKFIISLDQVSDAQKEAAQKKNITLLSWQEVCESGKKQMHNLADYQDDKILTFSYTSGTTGNPKGAMLNHKNFVSSAAIFKFFKSLQVTPNDVYLSYLPLPHVFDRDVCLSLMTLGAQIYFISGEIQKTLLEDIQQVKPTLFISVPRLYNKFYDSIRAEFDKLTGIKKFLVQSAISKKMGNINKGVFTHMLYDKLVFNKIKNKFGGRIRIAISGSAPLSGEVQNFLRIALCCPVIQGYGPTEATAADFVQIFDDIATSNVGGPLGHIEFKLVDVPDMEYTSEDKEKDGSVYPRGEVCMRGPGVFVGYYKDPENTAGAIDKDGFLHTGDIGKLWPNGSLQIIDRKKNIFKLSQGEYVAPEKIENVYLRARGVAEVFVYGDSLQSFLIAIVVPDRNYIEKELVTKFNLQSLSYEQLCQNEQVIKIISQNMEKEATESKLFGFEKAQKIYLEKESFIKHNCMTSTFKVQRHLAKKIFNPIIEKLYKQ